MTQYIEALTQVNPAEIKLYENEKKYAIKHQLLPENVKITLEDPALRFQDAYLERCEKGTIQLIIVEAPVFFNENIEHLKTHQREFLYVEASALTRLGVDALSMEFDDVSSTYTARFGLKTLKNDKSTLENALNDYLKDEQPKHPIAFSENGGLWNISLPINGIDGFYTEMTLLEAYELVYSFIFTILETVEETQ